MPESKPRPTVTPIPGKPSTHGQKPSARPTRPTTKSH